MSERRVAQIIAVAVEERPAGIAVATSPTLPKFYLVTTQARLEDDIPGAIREYYEIRTGQNVDVVPVAQDDELRAKHWAAIIACAGQSASR